MTDETYERLQAFLLAEYKARPLWFAGGSGGCEVIVEQDRADGDLGLEPGGLLKGTVRLSPGDHDGLVRRIAQQDAKEYPRSGRHPLDRRATRR
jgi:hypothetical protein